MSMFLPNPDVRPTGVEPGEFIDFSPTATELGTLGAESGRAPSPDSCSQHLRGSCRARRGRHTKERSS